MACHFLPLFFCWKPNKILLIHHLTDKIPFIELPKHLGFIAFLAEKLMFLIYRKIRVVTVSHSTKEELEERGFKNVEIVWNGVEFKRLRELSMNPGKKEDRPTIIYLGRIKRYKRLDHLLKAFKMVLEKIPNANLWIAGDGSALQEIKRLSVEIGISKAVKFWGRVSEKEKAELLARSWVFVTLSMKEGWGITVIEANACGTPVVAYNVPGLRDSVRDGYNGILVENGDVKGLADAIIRLLEDEDRRGVMGRNAVEWAKRFSWEKSAERFEEILRGGNS